MEIEQVGRFPAEKDCNLEIIERDAPNAAVRITPQNLCDLVGARWADLRRMSDGEPPR
jgi:hypothetical protein